MKAEAVTSQNVAVLPLVGAQFGFRRAQSHVGLPWGLSVENSPAGSGGSGLIPGWGRCLRGEHGNLLLHSCLENPMDRGGWWSTTTQRRSNNESRSKTKLGVYSSPLFLSASLVLLCLAPIQRTNTVLPSLTLLRVHGHPKMKRTLCSASGGWPHPAPCGPSVVMAGSPPPSLCPSPALGPCPAARTPAPAPVCRG